VNETIGTIAIILTLLAVIFGGVYMLESATCAAKWQNSGMPSSFSVFGGCQLTLPDGRVVPASAYRQL
jgi:hypothetical protein